MARDSFANSILTQSSKAAMDCLIISGCDSCADSLLWNLKKSPSRPHGISVNEATLGPSDPHITQESLGYGTNVYIG